MSLIIAAIYNGGVAIAADSLASTIDHIMTSSNFVKKCEPILDDPGSTADTVLHVFNQFKEQRILVRPDLQKLFRYDNMTCIGTAGVSTLSEQHIENIVYKILGNSKPKKKVKDFNIVGKANKFASEMQPIIWQHLLDRHFFPGTSFLIIQYNPKAKQTEFCLLNFKAFDYGTIPASMEDVTYEVIPVVDEYIITLGDSSIAENILYGYLAALQRSLKIILDEVSKNGGVQIPSSEADIRKLIEHFESQFEGPSRQVGYSNVNLNLRKEQALDLVAMLLNAEVMVQRLTTNEQTVGSPVRIYKIDAEGFSHISNQY